MLITFRPADCHFGRHYMLGVGWREPFVVTGAQQMGGGPCFAGMQNVDCTMQLFMSLRLTLYHENGAGEPIAPYRLYTLPRFQSRSRHCVTQSPIHRVTRLCLCCSLRVPHSAFRTGDSRFPPYTTYCMCQNGSPRAEKLLT